MLLALKGTMQYREEIVKAMRLLNEESNTLFLGQSVEYPGNLLFNTLEDAGVSMDKRIEMPVAEDMQMGISIGLSLRGYLPISIYPRMDFLIIAMNQLVNHLDKMEEYSHGEYSPKVIIRAAVASKWPLYPGPQHHQDYTTALGYMLKNINIVKPRTKDIALAYKNALLDKRSTILVEEVDFY